MSSRPGSVVVGEGGGFWIPLDLLTLVTVSPTSASRCQGLVRTLGMRRGDAAVGRLILFVDYPEGVTRLAAIPDGVMPAR